MRITLTKPWLAVWAMTILAACPALAQHPHGEGNLAGVLDPRVSDLQLWAPADVTPYGGDIRPPKGFFFTYDYVKWWLGSPNRTPIGLPSTEGRLVYYGPTAAESVVQTNSVDAAVPSRGAFTGSRFQLGYMGDHDGLMFGIYDLHSLVQDFVYSGADMVWADPEFGPTGRRLIQGYYLVPGFDPDADPPEEPNWPPDVPEEDRIFVTDADGNEVPVVLRNLPVTFDELIVRNRIKHWNAELMATHRCHPCVFGGIIEVFAGARYFEFDETFDVIANNVIEDQDGALLDDVLLRGKSLANSTWTTVAENHVIGPQVGARWFLMRGPWTFSAEGRFLAGFNLQNFRQAGTIGSELPLLDDDGILLEGTPSVLRPTTFSHVAHEEEWSPVVELRLDLKYQFTRSVFGRVGWTGIWMDGIARSSNMVLYEVPNMGILANNNSRDLFINGVTAGVTVNY